MPPVEDNPNNTIQELNQDWPLDSDSLGECDNHLREIKSVLTTNFPLFNSVLPFKTKELNDLYTFMGETTDRVLIFSTSTYRPLPDKQARNLNINQKGVLSSELPQIPLGSFYYSLISPSRMNQLYPNSFTIPDGKNVAGSKYAEITGRTTVPNVFELTKPSFLRPITGANVLNANVAFTTAKNGLNLINSGTQLAHDHGGASHNHNYSDNRNGIATDTGETHGYTGTALTNGINTGPATRVDTSRSMISEFRHGHSVTISDADHETAPRHYLMYLYIRIN
jgi:hypothetical protein